MSGPSRDRLRVKICGLRRPEEALLAVDLGADFLGLNFHPPSPRSIDLEQARGIARAVAGRALLVGVFVNLGVAEVKRIAAAVPLDLLQFHGDEGPADLAPFGRRAIKALRVEEQFDGALFEPYREVWGFVVDSRHPSLYGGSGQTWNFASVAAATGSKRVLIAGGLNPDNVRAAIAAARPYGIDVASGVESAPGVKDPELLRRLFEEIRHGESKSPA